MTNIKEWKCTSINKGIKLFSIILDNYLIYEEYINISEEVWRTRLLEKGIG
ncbi:MAG: hypothetical protein ACRC6T_02000 [Sarcina sp.]